MAVLRFRKPLSAARVRLLAPTMGWLFIAIAGCGGDPPTMGPDAAVVQMSLGVPGELGAFTPWVPGNDIQTLAHCGFGLPGCPRFKEDRSAAALLMLRTVGMGRLLRGYLDVENPVTGQVLRRDFDRLFMNCETLEEWCVSHLSADVDFGDVCALDGLPVRFSVSFTGETEISLEIQDAEAVLRTGPQGPAVNPCPVGPP